LSEAESATWLRLSIDLVDFASLNPPYLRAQELGGLRLAFDITAVSGPPKQAPVSMLMRRNLNSGSKLFGVWPWMTVMPLSSSRSGQL